MYKLILALSFLSFIHCGKYDQSADSSEKLWPFGKSVSSITIDRFTVRTTAEPAYADYVFQLVYGCLRHKTQFPTNKIERNSSLFYVAEQSSTDKIWRSYSSSQQYSLSNDKVQNDEDKLVGGGGTDWGCYADFNFLVYDMRNKEVDMTTNRYVKDLAPGASKQQKDRLEKLFKERKPMAIIPIGFNNINRDKEPGTHIIVTKSEIETKLRDLRIHAIEYVCKHCDNEKNDKSKLRSWEAVVKYSVNGGPELQQAGRYVYGSVPE